MLVKNNISKKDLLITGVMIILIFSLVGCSKATTEKTEIKSHIALEELPKNYTIEMAINNGDFVDVHGAISNEKVMDDFIKKVSLKEDTFIRTVRITTEGDPIIIDFSYSGGKFKVITDNSRDAFGAKTILTGEYKNLVTYENENGKVYMISNLDKITDEDYENGFDAVQLKFEPSKHSR